MAVSEFIKYCEEKKVFPTFLLKEEAWQNNMTFLFSKIREWYNHGGKEPLEKYLKGNIIIVEGIISEEEIKNCPDCLQREEKEALVKKNLSIVNEVRKQHGPGIKR